MIRKSSPCRVSNPWSLCRCRPPSLFSAVQKPLTLTLIMDVISEQPPKEEISLWRGSLGKENFHIYISIFMPFILNIYYYNTYIELISGAKHTKAITQLNFCFLFLYFFSFLLLIIINRFSRQSSKEEWRGGHKKNKIKMLEKESFKIYLTIFYINLNYFPFFMPLLLLLIYFLLALRSKKIKILFSCAMNNI